MALYTMDIGLDVSDDLSKVKSYLYMLDEELRYMFANLSPEDNWNDSAKLIFAETGEKIATLEVSVDGIAASVQDNETNYNTSMRLLSNLLSLNASTPDASSSIVLTGDRIALSTGKFTVNSKNLTIDENGNAAFSGELKAATGTFSGSVEAATFTGVTINGLSSINCGDDFFISTNPSDGKYDFILGDFEIGRTTRGSRGRSYYALYTDGNALALWEDGVIWGTEIYINDDTGWWAGTSVTDVCYAMWYALKNGCHVDPNNYYPEWH